MNEYECTNCGEQYKSRAKVCKLKCPKCGSNKHKLLKAHNPKNFKF